KSKISPPKGQSCHRFTSPARTGFSRTSCHFSSYDSSLRKTWSKKSFCQCGDEIPSKGNPLTAHFSMISSTREVQSFDLPVRRNPCAVARAFFSEADKSLLN